MEYRLLDTKSNSAAMNMAIDEAILQSGIPTLRFFGWNPPAVSIGYFQGILQEVDLEACQGAGIDVVRRLTGGGAVFHDKEITYSFFVSEESKEVSRDIIESYGQICGFIIDGLKSLGLNATFAPVNDITVNGKKISGNAQTRRRGMILQHGTILLDVDVKKMFSLLKVPDEKIRDKMISAVEERVTSVSHELGKEVGYGEVKESIIQAFNQPSHMRSAFTKCKEPATKLQVRNLVEGELSNNEKEKAQKLFETKYATRKWNHLR